MEDKFYLADLDSGMVVKIRGSEEDGNVNKSYLVMCSAYSDILINKDGWLNLSMYNADLQFCGVGAKKFDIMEIYEPLSISSIRAALGSDTLNFDHMYTLVWKRKEESSVEMTVAEIEEKLGIKNLKIIKEHEDE